MTQKSQDPNQPPIEMYDPPQAESLMPELPPPPKKPSPLMLQRAAVQKAERIVRFRGRGMLLVPKPFPHFEPLRRERFDEIAYQLIGPLRRSQVADLFAYVVNTAEDLTHMDRYIGTGMAEGPSAQAVWDTTDLTFTQAVRPQDCVWRVPFQPAAEEHEVEFVMQLAGGDPLVYQDMMQSLAPLVMDRKPDGVIWWCGSGANGKSTLMDAVYRLFPGQLSSLTVRALTDERDAPMLNGHLANVVKESSEGRIDDTQIYKNIGTHEDFSVHRFNTQEGVTVRGNMHHIFSANNIPSFNDKGYSARRRTLIVQFTQQFAPDPTFEERTFVKPLFEQLFAEVLRWAVILRDDYGYQYHWSKIAQAAKDDYDADSNSAEDYAKELREKGLVAFDSFGGLEAGYQNWCLDFSFPPMGRANVRKAFRAVGFERRSVRLDDGQVLKRYLFKDESPTGLVAWGPELAGCFTRPGLKSHRINEGTPLRPDGPPKPRQQEMPLEEDEAPGKSDAAEEQGW